MASLSFGQRIILQDAQYILGAESPLHHPCALRCVSWPCLCIFAELFASNSESFFVSQAYLCNHLVHLCAYQAPLSKNRLWELPRSLENLICMSLPQTAFSLLVVER
jgi:hypothetical protein